MDIKKKVCDACKTERKTDEMYLTIKGDFTFTIKYEYGFKTFNRTEVDFCSLDCFKHYIEKTLMKNY